MTLARTTLMDGNQNPGTNTPSVLGWADDAYAYYTDTAPAVSLYYCIIAYEQGREERETAARRR